MLLQSYVAFPKSERSGLIQLRERLLEANELYKLIHFRRLDSQSSAAKVPFLLLRSSSELSNLTDNTTKC